VELEALKLALNFCFQGLSLHRVTAECEATDAKKRQLFKDLGLRQEAEFVKHLYVNHEWQSAVSFAMLEEEYLKSGVA
jgi:RimJ/RimL family protein N-acetyltransferase